MKLLVLFDMKSEKVFAIVGRNCLKVRIFFNFFDLMFFYCMLQVFMHIYLGGAPISICHFFVRQSVLLPRTISQEPYII